MEYQKSSEWNIRLLESGISVYLTRMRLMEFRLNLDSVESKITLNPLIILVLAKTRIMEWSLNFSDGFLDVSLI